MVNLLEAEFRVTRGQFDLELSLTAGPGEVVALVGPNGAGKTTTVRVLAGLLPPGSGSIRVAGRQVAGGGTFLPPHERPVGVVFQDYLLFPHLSVLDNVAFGLRTAGMSRSAARQRAAEWLERMEAADLSGLRPHQLSGGQAQRVALARSLARKPALLLLDEPLAALDARTRLRIRGELRRLLDSFDGATVVITHDPIDAAVLADRLVVIENGRVVQTGTPQEVASRPRTDYVARLAGLNLLRGVGVDLQDGDHSTDRPVDHGVRLEDGTVIAVPEPVSGRVFVAFRPSAVSLWRGRPAGSPRNVWPVEVRGLEPYGDSVRVELARSDREPAGLDGTERSPAAGFGFVAEITVSAVADLKLVLGDRLWTTLKASEIEIYPA
jgi:molybdate transport system ATP-binding protein